MQPSSQTNIGATTKIPQPCPPNPAVKPRRNCAPPAQNKTPTIKPANTSTPTSAVVVIPRTCRKSVQTTMVVEQPQIQPPSISNSKLARSCTQCEPTKLLENSASLMYHKKYEHATVVFCPVPNCSYGNRPYKNWNSLRGSHIKTKHVRIWEQLKNAPAYYKSQPYYEKLHKVDLEIRDDEPLKTKEQIPKNQKEFKLIFEWTDSTRMDLVMVMAMLCIIMFAAPLLIITL